MLVCGRSFAGPGSGSERLSFADLELDLLTRDARRGTREIELSRIEFDLLELFLRHPRQVLLRDVIYQHVWGYDSSLGSNSLDVFVGHLRRKLEAGRRAASNPHRPRRRVHVEAAMSFRLRLTVLASLAVAVTVVGTSCVVYFTDRSALIGQIDSDLKAHQIDALLATRPGRPTTKTPRSRRSSPGRRLGHHPQRTADGRHPGHASGRQHDPRQRPSRTAGSAPAQRPTLSTQMVAGVRSRVLTLTFPRRVVRLSESLAQADRNLGHLRWLLVLISLGGLRRRGVAWCARFADRGRAASAPDRDDRPCDRDR